MDYLAALDKLETQLKFGDAETDVSKERKAKFGKSLFYVPLENINRYNGIIFMGVNPGGTLDSADKACELSFTGKGLSSYHAGKWLGVPGEDRLQIQVRKMFVGLFGVLRQSKFSYQDFRTVEASQDYREFFSGVIASNIFPFRSQNQGQIEHIVNTNKAHLNEFWTSILGNKICSTKLIISMGKLPYSYFSDFLKSAGYSLEEETNLMVGWGKIKASYCSYAKAGHRIQMIKLPHLSRFSIFRDGPQSKGIQELFSKLKPSENG